MKIGVVVLNYNSFSDTIGLVEDLQNQSLNNHMKIVVVDNNSVNDSYKKLKGLEVKYPNVVVLQTGSNLGYARGNNFGLRYLEENINPEFVAILNNDIEVDSDCFEKLIEKYNALKSPAIIAPKQLDLDLKEVLPYCINSFLDDCLSLFFITKIFHKRKANKFIDNTGLKTMRVDMIPGSFMFVSFERFKEMGYFYHKTFLFAEERFLSVKAKEFGWNNYILLDQSYIHAHSKTINTAYNQSTKYRLLYDSWLEFTKVCRSYGNVKARFLKPLMKLSLIEMTLVYRIQSSFKAKKPN